MGTLTLGINQNQTKSLVNVKNIACKNKIFLEGKFKKCLNAVVVIGTAPQNGHCHA